METFGNKISDKIDNKFFCLICKYKTNHKGHYDEHIKSIKHTRRKQMETNGNKIDDISDKTQTLFSETIYQQHYRCEKCNKSYKSRSGFWKHNKVCLVINNQNYKTNIIVNGNNNSQLIEYLINENKEMKDYIMNESKEMKELVLEIVKNGTGTINNTTHTNSHNKAFNLNFFLNETCKNAMNITDFVDSIKLQLSDFIEVGESGFIQGISNIIVKKLNDLDETIRPIHCTDQKRETFYVKDEDKWEKEEEDLKRIRRMINRVASKNERLSQEYKKVYPDYKEYDSKRSDQYSKFIIEALGGQGDNINEKHNKIINHISRATTIKNKFK
jgi:hypothetical protein